LSNFIYKNYIIYLKNIYSTSKKY